MILQISTTHRPATDLGYLLHKNPSRLQSFNVTFGKIHVFTPKHPKSGQPLRSSFNLSLANPSADASGFDRQCMDLLHLGS